ncbi:hypothetical protein RQP46_009886 [Phenoliferia psychrophenolica]
MRSITTASTSLALLLLGVVAFATAVPLPSSNCDAGNNNNNNNGPYRVASGSQDPSAPCPYGWTLSLLDLSLCVQITDGDYVPTHTTKKKHHTPTKSKSGKKKMKPSYSPKPTHSSHHKEHHQPEPTAKHGSKANPEACPEGQERSLLNVCVDILGIKGGIQIGGTPPSKRPKGSPKPACDGANDPRIVLKLCVVVGDSQDPLVKVGANAGEDGGSVFGGGQGGIKIGNHPDDNGDEDGLRIGTDDNGDDGSPTKTKEHKKPKSTSKALPPCKKDDPRALLNLCIKLDSDGLGVGADVGGDGDDGGLLGLGGILKLGKQNPGGKGSKDAPLLDAGASVDSNGIKASAALGDAPLLKADLGNGGLDLAVPGLLNLATKPSSSKAKSADTAPLLSVKVPGLINAQVGGSQKPKQPAAKDCGVGFLLHLGICIKADVKVPGVAHAKATVGV